MRSFLLGWTLAITLCMSMGGLVLTAEAGTPPPLLGGGTQDGKRILPGPEDPLSTKGKNYISKYFAPGLVNGFLLILFFASVVAIIVAGVMYILSSGDQELTKKAKDVIFWAIVGALIAAMAYAMVRFVVNIDFYGDDYENPAVTSTR